MKTEQIYTEWISSIDLTKTRIVQFPSFIFLCGGRISENGQNNFLSCRDIFYSYINRKGCSFRDNVILAEKIFEYFEHSDYQDLLIFERDLAELSSLTVIFSESPGSIAELGSFAVLNTIQERLLVVMHQDDTHQESFIWRGPVSFLKNLAKKKGTEDPISIYNWKKRIDDNCNITIEDFSDAVDLSETIELILGKRDKTISLKKEQLGHIMLLIVSSLKIVQLATLEEVIFLLNAYGVNVDKKQVKQYLSLLKSLGLIVLKPYRNYEFYLAAPQNDWISWGFNTETARNRDVNRWMTQFIDFYDTNQKEKHRALRSYLTSTGQVGD